MFIDVDMAVGTRWSQEIARQIDACDCLIVVLSAETVESEMVLAEVRLAHQRQARDGKPVILPVRVDYTGPLGYELGAYLDPCTTSCGAARPTTPRCATGCWPPRALARPSRSARR